jgi:hypothetical protein
MRIAMWSGPRNISTAMMRSWEHRSDTVVIDEPFYAHYLTATGLHHPGREEALAAQDTEAAVVADMLAGPAPDGADIWYQKHMAHHHLHGMPIEWMQSVVSCFLIRSPQEMLPSLHAKTPFPTLADTGLPQQVELFDAASASKEVPPVLDARDVLEHPRATLGAFCDRLGLPFDEAMLSWPSGPRESDGAWAPYWYDAVWASTGFKPWKPNRGSIPDAMQTLLAECNDCYDHLYQHRLRA